MIYKVGDLLIREHDECPCVVLEARETTACEWGQLNANRRQYRLFDGTSDSERWYADTVIHASFRVPVPDS